MKNYFFLPVLFLLAVSQSFAQKTLAPSLKPYADNWSHNVKRMLNHAGFDLQAAAVNKISSRGDLQLDSTKTFYAYNLPAPGDSTPLFRTIYQYPTAIEAIETNYQFEGNVWQPINRTTITRDAQQRIVLVTGEGYDWDSQSFVPDSRLESYPHGNSQDLLDSFFVYAWNTDLEDWELLLSTQNVFDDNDRLMEQYSIFDLSGTVLEFKDVYLYNDNGDNHIIETYALFDGFEFNTGRTEIQYFDHQPIEVTVFVTDGLEFFPQSRRNYAYTLFGAVRLELGFEWNVEKEDWRMIERTEYGYDNQQRVASKETTFINQDAPNERELQTFGYVQDDYLLVEYLLFWDDNLFDWMLDSKKFYYYAGLVSVRPTPRPALALQIAPNPTTDAVRLNLQEETTVQVFNTAGNLVQSRLIQPGQSLNLVELPAGIYQVTAQQGADFYSGKIVKQ